jgi:hypothetical protein
MKVINKSKYESALHVEFNEKISTKSLEPNIRMYFLESFKGHFYTFHIFLETEGGGGGRNLHTLIEERCASGGGLV